MKSSTHACRAENLWDKTGGKLGEKFLLAKIYLLYMYISCSIYPDNLEGAESSHTVVEVTAQNETGSLNRILKAFRVST